MEQLDFIDLDSGDSGVVIVRRIADGIGLALSLMQDGDVEVFLDESTARRVVGMIETVLQMGQPPPAVSGGEGATPR